MSYNSILPELEQAIIEKQNLFNSLNNIDLNDTQRAEINAKIREIDTYLLQLLNNIASTKKPSLAEVSLQAKVNELQRSLQQQQTQNQNLQLLFQNILKNGPNTMFDRNGKINPDIANQINQLVNNNYEQATNNLENKILDNTAKITGLKPSTISEYLHLGWDYLVRDRLPKLFSTRLWLIIGGGYLTELLGKDTTVKIVAILLLVIFYILSEALVKSSSNIAGSKNKPQRFY